MLLCQGSCVGSNPTGRFYFSVWERLEIRVPRAHETVGSNPATLTDVMRWVLCWYGKATVNRRDAGSIPATAAGYQWKSSGRMRSLPRKQVRAKCPLWVQVPRLPLDGEYTCPWPSGKGASLPSWTGGFDSRRALLSMRSRFWWETFVALNDGSAGSIPASATIGSHPAGSKARPPTGREKEGSGRGSRTQIENR